MSEQQTHTTPVGVILRRVAAEMASAACELAELEARLAVLLGSGLGDRAELEQLQTLDRLGQQLRVLELFLATAAPVATGEIDLSQALPTVWLEGVKARLAGGTAVIASGQSAEFW